MNKQDLYTLISNVFGIELDEIDMESDLTEDLNADHTSLVELKLQLEDLTKANIDQEEFDEVETVEDLYTLLDQYDVTDDL